MHDTRSWRGSRLTILPMLCPHSSVSPSRKPTGAAGYIRTHSAQVTPSASPQVSKRTVTSPTAVVQRPGQIDNTSLVMSNSTKTVASLTNEGGRLRRDRVLARGRDFELVPEAVWQSLLAWYGGQPGLPRSVSQRALSDITGWCFMRDCDGW